MRQIRIALTMLALTTAAVAPASAQTPDADCQAGRERLAGHARASEAVRKVLSARVGTAPAAGAPSPPAAPPTGAIDADRVPCRDVATTLDAALRAPRRELGAREAQAGAIPLAPLRGQTATAVARELAAQFAAWPEAASQVGLLY